MIILNFWIFLKLISFVISSDVEDFEEREFVPISSRSANFQEESGEGNFLDDILMDESVSISLNCEKSLGSSEEALKAFVMKSLDFNSEETLTDLERPSCRAFFDRNGNQLSKEQISQLMSSERGQGILMEGEVLEFFSDFSEFTLKDFNRFPSLQVGKIRNLSSIQAEVLLALVKQRGYLNAGRLERIPETFGERVFDNEAWKLDPEIWQLFTLEGIAQIHSISLVEKFSKFLSDRSKFENLIFTINEFDTETVDEPVTVPPRLRSCTVSSDTSIRSSAATSSTSTPICKSIAKHSNLLARWAVQCEELILYLIELPEISRSSSQHLSTIQNAVKLLITTRGWLKDKLKERCIGAAEISDTELLHLTNLKTILETPMAWRLKEALRIFYDGSDVSNDATQMTKTLKNRLSNFPTVTDFYRPIYHRGTAQLPPNDHLLTHFFLVNEISNLETIFETETVGLVAANEKLVLSIALRRILLLLLSPSLESSNVIQDALNYVFSARSPLLATSDSNEIVRWFRQAHDLQAIPVLDRLIRSFGHEFDVSREIHSMLRNRQMRLKLFSEAQSAFVRLLVALSNVLSEHLIEDAPKILSLPYVDPANALLKIQVPALPIHPNRRPHSEEEIAEHSNQVDQVKEHNAAIAQVLQTSLCFLQTFSVDEETSELSPNFAGFIQPNFRIQFDDNVGIDAGGLRRTWLSALLRIFGDSQRMLFPMHMDDGGRTPAALLDPEIMSHLGALHGKALQIGVKPDWFFTRQYTHSVLFAKDVNNSEGLLQVVEELYPEIFGSLDLILQIESEEAAVEYFNSSEFPTIEGLSHPETVSVTSTATAGDITAVSENNLASFTGDSTVPQMAPDSPAHLTIQINGDSDDDSLIVTQHTNRNGNNADNANPATRVTVAKPPRHSFSRMLVFDVRYLAQPSIYNGPRQTVTSLSAITAYRTSLLTILASNLLEGSQAYWRTFSIFFDEEMRGRMEAEFLHDLLEPPQVTIEEVLTKVHFHRSCDSIFLIDDEASDNMDISGDYGDSAAYGSRGNSPNEGQSPPSLKRARSSPAKISNITARAALTRILSTSFTTPQSINSLLSFSTGCPQIPPAGLDALRLSVHCYTATPASSKMSKSHTCSNTIDFYASMHYKETKDAFLESAISSSGFGFD